MAMLDIPAVLFQFVTAMPLSAPSTTLFETVMLLPLATMMPEPDQSTELRWTLCTWLPLTTEPSPVTSMPLPFAVAPVLGP